MAGGAEGLDPLVDPEPEGAEEAALSPELLSPELLSLEPVSGGFFSEDPELDSELEDPDEEPADSLDRGRLSVL